MDYAALADELLAVRIALLKVPASQSLSRMVKGELFVLNYMLNRDRGVHPKELSEQMAVSTARIASLLNHMEGKGLIRRCADQHDNRQVLVLLTDDGQAMIRRVRQETLAHLANMLETLGPEDAEAYIRIQNKILSNMRK